MANIVEGIPEACAGCGLVLRGGTAGCQALFEELLARDFSDVVYFTVHRMMVDAYSLQHPDRYCASAKSFAAHLTGLCWILERGGSAAVGGEPLRRWLNGSPRLEKPDVPVFRGGLTIADVHGAPDASAYATAVENWARTTWTAYGALHAQARQWIEDALGRHDRPAQGDARPRAKTSPRRRG